LQADFILELFKLCKEDGINTVVDTSGYIFNEKVKDVLEYTDLILLDIKAIDEKVYKELTGVELENTLKFAQYLKEKGKRVWIRHVIVPGITDNDELLNRLAEYVSNLDNVEKVELLPYHKLGEFKYKELGMKYVLEGVEELSKERLENAVSIFQKYNLKVN
ncbi:MAG: radical SAM protein, partial [Fusobacterium varium]|nr:radical SAM protein [Fusobacterium varium]